MPPRPLHGVRRPGFRHYSPHTQKKSLHKPRQGQTNELLYTGLLPRGGQPRPGTWPFRFHKRPRNGTTPPNLQKSYVVRVTHARTHATYLVTRALIKALNQYTSWGSRYRILLPPHWSRSILSSFCWSLSTTIPSASLDACSVGRNGPYFDLSISPRTGRSPRLDPET